MNADASRSSRKYVYYLTNSGGLGAGGPEARLKKGPPDDVIILSQTF